MPSLSPSSVCVPPAQVTASDVFIPPIIAKAICPVNRHGDIAPDDNGGMSEMGKRVRALRKARGLTQVQLAALLRVSQPGISDIERGDTHAVTGETLTALARALQTNPDWIITGKGSPAPAVSTGIEEGELLAIFRELRPDQREALMIVARSMSDQNGQPPTAANPFRRPARATSKQS